MAFRFILIMLFLAHYANSQVTYLDKIDSILENSSKVAGPSEIILVNDKEVLHQANFGTDQIGKVGISSSSKWLAAATVLTLVDDGALELDEKIGSYIRQFKGEMGEITIRQLLAHTSGLAANSIFVVDPDLELSKSVKRIARKASLITPPGSQFVYGDVSYQIVGHLAEVVSGKDWESLFQGKIARPCEMDNTNFGNEAHINIAQGAYSTAEDFSNFLMMILNRGVFNGKRVLSAKMIDEMLTNQIEDVKIGYTPYYFKSAMLSDYYGLGCWINRIMVSDSSVTEVSTRGTNGFIPWANFCGNVAGVFAFNSDLAKAEPYVIKCRDLINRNIKECRDVEPDERAYYEGNSEVEREVIDVVVKLEKDAMVSLRLFDILGNEIMVLINGKTKAGTYLVPIETTYLARGNYFYKLTIDDKEETKKVRVR